MGTGKLVDESIGDALRAYAEARDAALTDARRSVGLTELDTRALLFIADNPGVRPGELARRLGVTSAAVTTLTDRLIARDAIRRESDEDDRRAVRLYAIVDLHATPWSALSSFDERIDEAAARADTPELGSVSSLIARLTRAASAAS